MLNIPSSLCSPAQPTRTQKLYECHGEDLLNLMDCDYPAVYVQQWKIPSDDAECVATIRLDVVVEGVFVV